MYSALWALLRPYRFSLSIALLLQAIAGISSLLPWIAISQIIFAPAADYLFWIIFASVAGLIWLVSQTLALYLTHQTDGLLCFHLRQKLLKKISHLPLSWFIQSGKEGINRSVDRDIRALHQLTAHAPADIVQLLILPITAAAILFYLNSLLMLFCLIPLVIVVLLFKTIHSPKFHDLFAMRNKAMNHLFEQYSELAANPVLARQFPEKGIQQSVTQAVHQFIAAFSHWVNKIGSLGALTQLGLSTGFLTLWILLGAILITDQLHLSELALFILLMRSLTAPVAAMGHGLEALQQATSASQRLDELLSQPEMHYGEQSLKTSDITLYGHNLSYQLQGKTILSNLDFSIPAGSLVVIAGPSGAGKTTLLQLLARFSDPTKGQITLNETPLSELSMTALNQALAVVMQKTQPLSVSIKDNLTLFAPEATDAEIEQVIIKTNLQEVIDQQSQGLDTCIGQDVLLSGGEAQRLAIARALLIPTPILLLDEPTSALDPENAQYILQTLLAEKRTRVMITHDLSFLQHADQVIYMENGQILAQGRHLDLMATDSHYKNQLTAQENNHEI